MTTTQGRGSGTVRGSGGPLLLRLLAGAGLALNAVLHVTLAQGPKVADGQVTIAGLFLLDAVAAGLAALLLLVRPGRLAWLAVALVAVPSLLALVVSTYVLVPSVGPLPAVYEPFWYAEKVLAAVGAAVAAVAALVALAVTRASGR